MPHESGGIVWTYMGPQEKMTGFRDFGSEGAGQQGFAFKSISYCNWVQRMEGNIDTSHISWLHQYEGVQDIPDDGTDVAGGYPSYKMSWKIWRHDRAPRLEVDDTWYGCRYAHRRLLPPPPDRRPRDPVRHRRHHVRPHRRLQLPLHQLRAAANAQPDGAPGDPEPLRRRRALRPHPLRRAGGGAGPG